MNDKHNLLLCGIEPEVLVARRHVSLQPLRSCFARYVECIPTRRA